MDLKKIQELIKLVNKTNIAELTIEDNEGKISIKQKEDKVIQSTANYMPIQPFNPQQASNQNLQNNQQTNNPTITNVETNNYITIKSPMIGTFYKRPTPDKPNFVEEGAPIEIGKVICIIEAMKLFNEIESEYNGTIVQILVEDASPVEFDQPLFIISPK
ncbi:MAG: acetyl-CoA carboxylase biotin carboxyl carrier protein, partial [Sediminibacterium sp.]|nr:acetyl-CoA carboxylase biotin carboxyl carrier protein [Sediminibacterium sp.]